MTTLARDAAWAILGGLLTLAVRLVQAVRRG